VFLPVFAAVAALFLTAGSARPSMAVLAPGTVSTIPDALFIMDTPTDAAMIQLFEPGTLPLAGITTDSLQDDVDAVFGPLRDSWRLPQTSTTSAAIATAEQDFRGLLGLAVRSIPERLAGLSTNRAVWLLACSPLLWSFVVWRVLPPRHRSRRHRHY
jgi:hypothetical protein